MHRLFPFILVTFLVGTFNPIWAAEDKSVSTEGCAKIADLSEENQLRIDLAIHAAQQAYPNNSEFELQDYLGMGSYAVALRAKEKQTGRIVAIKVMEHFSPHAAIFAENELAVYQTIRAGGGSSHIAEFISGKTWEGPLGEHVRKFTFVVLELLPEDAFDSLLDIMASTRDQSIDAELEYLSEISRFASHVLRGLSDHNRLVGPHRDIKPENVLGVRIDGRITYKIVDEGFAGENIKISCGSIPYQSPSNWVQEDSTCDAFAFGMTLARLLSPSRFGIFPGLVGLPADKVDDRTISILLGHVYRRAFRSSRELADCIHETQARLKAASEAEEEDVEENWVRECEAEVDRRSLIELPSLFERAFRMEICHLDEDVRGHIHALKSEIKRWYKAKFGKNSVRAERASTVLIDLMEDLVVVDPEQRLDVESAARKYLRRLEARAGAGSAAAAAAPAGDASSTSSSSAANSAAAEGQQTSDAAEGAVSDSGDAEATTKTSRGKITEALPDPSGAWKKQNQESWQFYLRRHNWDKGDAYRRGDHGTEAAEPARARVEDQSMFALGAGSAMTAALVLLTSYRPVRS